MLNMHISILEIYSGFAFILIISKNYFKLITKMIIKMKTNNKIRNSVKRK